MAIRGPRAYIMLSVIKGLHGAALKLVLTLVIMSIKSAANPKGQDQDVEKRSMIKID